MQRATDDTHAREGGFTLMEVMIAIVILGILAAITVFAVGGFADRGEKSACEANLKSAEIALEAYWAQNKAFPGTLAELTVEPNRLLRSEPAGLVYDGAGNVSSPDCTL